MPKEETKAALPDLKTAGMQQVEKLVCKAASRYRLSHPSDPPTSRARPRKDRMVSPCSSPATSPALASSPTPPPPLYASPSPTPLTNP
ncbi:vegetative cell wall protein gp1, partial [Hyalella azteca]|uniref:Vegetative cell wall protein gp1 n=1 Tax=Hyalella azteca TaxID=294128 RepID=A0A8B7MY08_HYAAZ